MSATRQFSTFVVAGHLCGLAVTDVQEVLRYQPITVVPLAPRGISGLLNLRGQIIMAVDLRIRLELPKRADDRPPMNVVVRTPEGAVSLLVDSIGDVLEVEENSFEALPATLTGPMRDLVTGGYKLHGQLLLVLDITKTLDLAA